MRATSRVSAGSKWAGSRARRNMGSRLSRPAPRDRLADRRRRDDEHASALLAVSALHADLSPAPQHRDLPSLLDEAFELLSGDLAAARVPAPRPSLADQARRRPAEAPSRP